MEPSPAAGNQEVRSRQVRSGNGWTVTEFMIDCPFRERTIALDECEQCSAFEGITAGDGGTPKAVSCVRIRPLPDQAVEVAALVRGALARTPVLRAAASSVVCVQRELPLHDLAGILVHQRIGGVPVVDDELRPVGMISKTDLVRHGLELTESGDQLNDRFGPDGSVADAMTAGAWSVGEHASLLDAAGLMADRGVHRASITGRDGRIVGLVTALDVLRWISREPEDARWPSSDSTSGEEP